MESVIGWEARSRHVRAASGIGLAFGLLFAVFNMLTPGMMALGLTEGVAVLVLVVPALILSHSPRQVRLAETLLLLSAGVIFGALMVFGGIEGTGLYWVHAVPFLAFFLKGERQGWIFSVVFLVVAAAYFQFGGPSLPWAYHFTPVAGTHFVLSLLFYTLVAAAFNHVRSRYEAQLAQRKDEAEASSLAKSRFLAAASHDLRQPAHAMGMFVARLGQLPHDSAARELVVGVQASVHALQEMLDAFFDYSRLDAPSMPVRLTDFPVNQLLDQVRTSFEAMAASKGLRLRIRPSGLWVHSDPALLHRVLLNLVSNAVQHTYRGSVLVCCRPTCGHTQARLEVWDSGIGIAPEHHASVFLEFFQVNNPQRDRAKGMGLGLSLVERACRLLGHTVTLRSALGCGARFGVQLPIASAVSATVWSPTPELPAQADLDGLQVLLIEDDVLGGVALTGLLQGWGCQVVSAVDADGACALVRQLPTCDVVVSDYRLPGAANGIAAIGQVRELLGRPLPAFVISGDMDASARQQAQDAGLPWLQKPVRPAKLRSVLRNLLRAREAESA